MIEGASNGRFLTPKQIYEELTGGPGSDTLSTAQRASYDEAERERDRARLITQIGRKIQAGWQGEAASGAFGAATPLADAALRGADDLFRAHDLLDRQSGSFHRAANSVVPVPAGPPDMEVDDFMNPVDYEKEVRAYQADAEHNMQVFEGYDNASSHNETYAPREYPIISHSGGNLSVTNGDTARSGEPEAGPSGGDAGASGSPSGGAPNSGWSPGGGQPGGSPPGGIPGPGGTPAPGSGGGQQTRPNDYVPPVAPPAGYQPPAVSQSGPAGGTTGGLPAAVPVGGYPGGGGSAGGSAGGRGGAPVSGPGPRAGGLGAGGGAGAATPGEGARGGVSGAAGARGAGAPGAMGAAPMSGGRGKNDEDSEHDRKYLVEPDPEETFGGEVLTAPQVIGDDEYEDD